VAAPVSIIGNEAYAIRRNKVDFINAQLGVGFSVPIIMLNHVLGIRDVGYIIATSGTLCLNPQPSCIRPLTLQVAITTLVSWIAVFF
jgi:hypothetical protein